MSRAERGRCLRRACGECCLGLDNILWYRHTQLQPVADTGHVGLCRRCTDQLLQAAAAAGADGGNEEHKDASAVAALRCSRCMALMLQVVKQGQVGTHRVAQAPLLPRFDDRCPPAERAIV
jgi:hypothetical protein